MKRNLWILLVLAAALTACGKLNLGGGGGNNPSPTPSASSSPTLPPTACMTPNPNASGNLVVVDMSSSIAATSAPTYGPIAGYAVVTSYTPPTTASLINSWVNGSGKTMSITTKNILQFVNGDSSEIHSAVGFPGDSFPAQPYKFTKAQQSPSPNTTIGASGGWWSGLIPASVSNVCYSQTFTLKAGTYYFGDYSYYNTATSYRDVLIVGTPGPFAHRKFVYSGRNRAHVR